MPDFVENGRVYYNPVDYAMHHIGGTWKMPVLWRLRKGVMRYTEIKKAIPHITHKMLTTQLRELEETGFVQRVAYPTVPPKVEYTLTPKGVRAIDIINVIRNYGLELMEEANLKEH
ncbi:MAG: transcriptional regulator [Cytophagales bacterium]|nr:MAG: transcriptional regulator [Cytophagales bacterium]